MKPKKILALWLATFMAISLIGCGDSSATNKTEEPTNETEVIEETTTPEVTTEESTSTSETISETPSEKTESSYVLTEFVFEGEDSDGFSSRTVVKIGQWVKASDTDAVNAAWKAVGGEGEAPKAEDFDYSVYHFKTSTSIMVFGFLTVVDTTQGDFSIAEDGGAV